MAEPRRVRVAEVVHETADASSFVLEPVDGRELRYRPGQFLTLRVPSDLTGFAARSYSLSSASEVGEPPRISVKRTNGGYASNWLCDHLRAGHEVEVLPPAGVFTPEDWSRPLLLVAAGSGVTPVLSILKAALHGQTPHVTLWYANRDESSVMFAAEIAELARTYPDRLLVVHWLESVQSRPTAAALAGHLAPWRDREVFLCGPAPFMDATEKALADLGVEERLIHTERFMSLSGDPFAGAVDEDAADADNAATVEVSLDGETHELRWPRTTPLLDVLLDAGLDAPYSCREGACSACACVLLEGEAEMRNNEVLGPEDIADGIVLGCQARPLTDRLRISYDE